MHTVVLVSHCNIIVSCSMYYFLTFQNVLVFACVLDASYLICLIRSKIKDPKSIRLKQIVVVLFGVQEDVGEANFLFLHCAAPLTSGAQSQPRNWTLWIVVASLQQLINKALFCILIYVELLGRKVVHSRLSFVMFLRSDEFHVNCNVERRWWDLKDEGLYRTKKQSNLENIDSSKAFSDMAQV